MIKYQGSTSSNCVNTATGSLMAKCDYLISHFAISFDARWLSRYFQRYNQFSWNASDVHWTRSKSIINCFPHHFRVYSIFCFIFRQNADFFIQKINKQDSWFFFVFGHFDQKTKNEKWNEPDRRDDDNSMCKQNVHM